jgi:hypothetical protein
MGKIGGIGRHVGVVAGYGDRISFTNLQRNLIINADTTHQ